MIKIYLFLFTCMIITSYSADVQNMPSYTDVKIQGLVTGGIRVTLKDKGYTSVIFYIRVFLNGNDQWNMYPAVLQNGVWTMYDRIMKIELNRGFALYFRFIKNNTQYSYTGVYTVTEFIDENIVKQKSVEEKKVCVTPTTITECGAPIICKGDLIFSEEFKTNIKESKFWQIERMFPQEPDYPFNAYLPHAVTVEDENLKITPSLTESYDFMGSNFAYKNWDLNHKCTGETDTRECYQVGSGAQILPPVISGKITTRNTFNFKYGRIEVRAKLPTGDWLIPEINLEPRYHEYGKLNHRSGLIRIAYFRGNKRFLDSVYNGVVFGDTKPTRSLYLQQIVMTNQSWGNDYHNFTIIWKPKRIEFYIDGGRFGDIVPNANIFKNFDIDNDFKRQMKAYKKGSSTAPFDELFYISLGVRVGGIHDYEDSVDKSWKNGGAKSMIKFWENKHLWHPSWISPELIVDYVRVYAE